MFHVAIVGSFWQPALKSRRLVVLAFEWKRTDSVFKDVDTSLELNCLTGREATYSVLFQVPLLVPKIMIR